MTTYKLTCMALFLLMVPHVEAESRTPEDGPQSGWAAGTWLNEGEQSRLVLHPEGRCSFKATDRDRTIRVRCNWKQTASKLHITWARPHPWLKERRTTYSYKRSKTQHLLFRKGSFAFYRRR